MLHPRTPLLTYDTAQRAADYVVWKRMRGHRITSPSFDEVPDAYERQEQLNIVVNLNTGADSAMSRAGAVLLHGLAL